MRCSKSSTGTEMDLNTKRINVGIITSGAEEFPIEAGTGQLNVGGSNIANSAGGLVGTTMMKRKAGGRRKILATLGTMERAGKPGHMKG